MSDETITQITMRKVREEWEAPLVAQIARMEQLLRHIRHWLVDTDGETAEDNSEIVAMIHAIDSLVPFDPQWSDA